nr:hypothetical protein [Nostoc sp. ChiSLP01]
MLGVTCGNGLHTSRACRSCTESIRFSSLREATPTRSYANVGGKEPGIG